MPPELKTKKSIIITRVDDAIDEYGENQMKEEFKDKNTWIGDDLDSIFRFPDSNTIKLTFTKTQLAKKCTEVGLKAFGISIPCHDIRQETYIPIKCCLKCYSLEDHTRECPKGPEYKLCIQATINGWSYEHYREYIRIRDELKETCKDNYNKNCEDQIAKLMNHRKNSKEFWKKLKY